MMAQSYAWAPCSEPCGPYLLLHYLLLAIPLHNVLLSLLDNALIFVILLPKYENHELLAS